MTRYAVLIVGSLLLIYAVTAYGEAYVCYNQLSHNPITRFNNNEVNWSECADLHLHWPFSFLR
jgi:hypothetical protein